jgi:UDP-N-acetylglucosamine--N-acetylmuramyl-(pentapeptide) pyrophosphoryl-undecaprenol N-acetylglucosamine transferase
MRVLIAGGGTGGHLFPGIALADEIRRRGENPILFVGTQRGIERRAVPAAGYDLEFLNISGLKRAGLWKTLQGLGRLPLAFLKSILLLYRFRPDVVIGVGGYASGPMLLTAAALGYPTAIQEQNSVPGFTNRTLGKLVRKVFIAFEKASTSFPPKKTELLGNPVRQAIVLALSAESASSQTPPCVLVVGGSQGAKAVNDLVLGAMAILQKEQNLPTILHQTGAAELDRIRARYAELQVACDARAFIDDMADAYRKADLVVARAGALTLAELALARKPAILIPLPTAADDHQTQNAQEFALRGAALVLQQRSTTPHELAHKIHHILANAATRTQMASAMGTLARPRATLDIVDRLQRLAGQ